MMSCPKCGNKMNKVMHFEADKNKNLQFYQCSNNKCKFETKKKKLILTNF